MANGKRNGLRESSTLYAILIAQFKNPMLRGIPRKSRPFPFRGFLRARSTLVSAPTRHIVFCIVRGDAREFPTRFDLAESFSPAGPRLARRLSHLPPACSDPQGPPALRELHLLLESCFPKSRSVIPESSARRRIHCDLLEPGYRSSRPPQCAWHRASRDRLSCCSRSQHCRQFPRYRSEEISNGARLQKRIRIRRFRSQRRNEFPHPHLVAHSRKA